VTASHRPLAEIGGDRLRRLRFALGSASARRLLEGVPAVKAYRPYVMEDWRMTLRSGGLIKREATYWCDLKESQIASMTGLVQNDR